LEVLRIKAIWMWVLRSNAENPGEGEEATAPSNIRKVQIIHGGKEMPPNGGIVFPENVQVKPFLPKG
jgi:hypothetical protein